MPWINARGAALGLALLLVSCTSRGERCGGHHCDPIGPARDSGQAFDSGTADATQPAFEAGAEASDSGTPGATQLAPKGDDSEATTAPECSSVADCELPEALLGCQACEDGSQRCPKVECVQGQCATAYQVCPERQRVAVCTSDADCRTASCDLLCQGDGRSACLPSRCSDGACVEVRGTCDLRPSSCPTRNRAAVLCAACGDAGGCAFEVVGCFEACDVDSDCTSKQPCADGVCAPAPACD